MEQKDFYNFFRGAAMTAFRTIIPWKKNVLEDSNPDWANGWNDCLKEIKKNRKNWLEKMDGQFAPKTKSNK